MDVFAEIRALVLEELAAMTACGALPAGCAPDPAPDPMSASEEGARAITLEPPKSAAHGDMACNAALVLAKQAGIPPRDLAQHLGHRLTKDARIAGFEVAGPGFLNLRLADDVWRRVLAAALNQGQGFGRSDADAGKSVNVEFVSANPTGPLHIGHMRGAVFGDVLANLLAFTGHRVIREYYVNDGGAQVDVLARSVYLRYLEARGHAVLFEEGTYPGDYLIPLGQALSDQVGDAYVGKSEEAWLEAVRTFAVAQMMELIRADLALLGVRMDRFFSERALYESGQIEAALKALAQRDLIYEGHLELPRGKAPAHWAPRKQTLFRSTAYGDDIDRPVRKSDGQWAYFASDIAYHYDKIQRGYAALINVFGADHGGYVKRMQAVVSALSDRQTPLDVKITQLVKLWKGGKPFKMSKRAGHFITLRQMVEQAGTDVARFVMLTRRNDAPLDFDFDKVRETSRENPVFYVQYAHARVCAILRKAEAKGENVSAAVLAQADLSALEHPEDLALMRKLAEWPRLVKVAARVHEPHRIPFYLYELAGAFHAHYKRGDADPALRFLQEAPQAGRARLALACGVSVVIASGLGILGVQPAQEM
ncbi:MAG: arginine--tRNA ligase [Rhodobacteraceae bacterium]|nr:arginine--tRNA ligase [Paracoccaceae bacterium]